MSRKQLLSQLLMSVLSLVGVLLMMRYRSPALALIAVSAVAASFGLAALLTARSQPPFIDQWRITGTVNAEIEEDYTGHALIKVFRHQMAARAQFDKANDALFCSS